MGKERCLNYLKNKMGIVRHLAGDKWTGEDVAGDGVAEVIVMGFQCHVEGLDAILRISKIYR